MKYIQLLTATDDAQLVSTQNSMTIPFRIKRVYYMYNIKPNTVRGLHAHKITKQALFCIQGSVTVRLDDGKRVKAYRLRSPHKGVFIDRMVWMKMYNFTPGAILLVFASEYHRISDYIRDYDHFRKLTQ